MKPHRASMINKVLRLGAFVLFAQTALSLVLVRGVRAQLQDLMRSAGAQMMQLGASMEQGGPPRTVRLNGAQVRMRAQRVPNRTLEDVLDLFEARCRATNGRFYEQLQQGERTQALGEAQLGLLDGVLREQSDELGSVACLDVGEELSTPSSILARAQQFASTGDIASFGHLRFVRAEKRNHGVFVVMMWTDGPFNIKHMFPRDGDAPGVDFPGLPRPPASRRILSAWEEGQSPAVNIYETTELDATELDKYYRRELVKLGWETLTPLVDKADAVAHGLVVMRDGVTVTLSQASVVGGRHATTTIMPMDTAGAIEVQ